MVRGSLSAKDAKVRFGAALALESFGDDAGDDVGRVGCARVLDEVTQFGVFLVADGGLERGGALGDRAHILHFLRFHAELEGKLFLVGLLARVLE